MEKGMVLAFAFTRLLESMRVNGWMIIGMEEVWRDIVTQTNTKENLKITNHMAKVFILGSMVKFMRVNGEVVWKKGRASGRVFLEIHTSENGPRAKLMVMAYISGKMEIDTKENGGFVLNMAKGQTCLQMETFTQVNTQRVNLMASGSTSGETHQFMLESSEEEWNMAKVNGAKGQLHKTAINMKVSTKMIKNKVLVLLLGKVEIGTEERTKMTKDMDTERCIGLTARVTKVNGLMVSRMVLELWLFLMDGRKRVFLKTIFTRTQLLIWIKRTN
jgi:hypothetical protein